MAYAGVLAKIPLGALGIVTDMPPASTPADAFIEADNVNFENGLLEKARGGLRWNESALPAGVVSVWDWWPDVATQRLIAVTSTGSVYRDIGDRLFSSNVAIASGLGVLTPNTVLVEGGQEVALRSKKLFFFTEGQKQVQVLTGDGTSLADITSPAADWTTPNFPHVGIIHRNRLWAFLDQRSYASNTGDHENFTSNFLTDSIFPGEGGAVIGAYVYKGRLFCFKTGGFVYYLEDSPADSASWFWRKLASNFGLASPHGAIEALNDMYAANTSGTVTSYLATEKFGDIEAADFFRNAKMEQYIHKNLNKGGLKELHALYYPEKKQMFFTYRKSSQLSNDTLVVIDVGNPAPRIYTQTKGTPQCLALRKDVYGVDRPMYGSYDGYVVLMDREDRLEATGAYEMKAQTSAIDFRHIDPNMATVEKHFDALSIEFVEEGNWDLLVDYYIDGKFVETLSYKMFIDPDYLGEFELDEDLLPYPHAKSRTKRLKGTGRSISFVFRQGGSNQNVQIAGITVSLRPGTDRQLRRES